VPVRECFPIVECSLLQPTIEPGIDNFNCPCFSSRFLHALQFDFGRPANHRGSNVDEFDRTQRRLAYTVVLSEDEGQFKSGKSTLPDDAKAKLDDLVGKLKADPNGAYFEIEGHTDALGTQAANEKIGLERAEAVKRYLFEQHQIPLHRINVISYGMDKPVASNKTREGRAQNRRVVIRVLV